MCSHLLKKFFMENLIFYVVKENFIFYAMKNDSQIVLLNFKQNNLAPLDEMYSSGWHLGSCAILTPSLP